MPETVLYGQRQRQFFRDARAFLIDQRKAVGVRVEYEADRRPSPCDLRTDIDEVGGDRLGLMSEDAIGSAADFDHFAAKLSEEMRRQRPASPTVSIEEDAKARRVNRPDADQVAGQFGVLFQKVGGHADDADAIPGGVLRPAGLKNLLDLFAPFGG